MVSNNQDVRDSITQSPALDCHAEIGGHLRRRKMRLLKIDDDAEIVTKSQN